MDNVGKPLLSLMFVVCQVSMKEQYNLTGSLPAAVPGRDFSWECSMSLPPGNTIHVVSFYRNNTLVGIVGRFPNGTCAAFDLSPRYDYQCDSDHVFSLIIPADNMTMYENNSVWRCEYSGDGTYTSSDQLLKIAVFIRNVSLSPNDNPLTLTEGTTTTVMCSVNDDAYPAPDIQWYIADIQIGGSKKTLELTAEHMYDAKTLRCLASNNEKSLSGTTVLNILYKPIVAVEPSDSLDVSLGAQMTVKCRVLMSNPGVILGYEWSVLGESDIVGKESDFTINRVSVKDNRTLQCRAKNSVGTSGAASVRINVLLVPARPNYIKVLCCGEHADVVWVSLTSGLVEQESFVQFTTSTMEKEFSNASSDIVNSTVNEIHSVRVTDLSLDATYTFRVVTVNQYGYVVSNVASCQVNGKFNEGLRGHVEVKLNTAPFSASSVVLGGTLGGLFTLATVVVVIMYLKLRRFKTKIKEDITSKSTRSTEKTNYEMQLSSIPEDHPYQEITDS